MRISKMMASDNPSRKACGVESEWQPTRFPSALRWKTRPPRLALYKDLGGNGEASCFRESEGYRCCELRHIQSRDTEEVEQSCAGSQSSGNTSILAAEETFCVLRIGRNPCNCIFSVRSGCCWTLEPWLTKRRLGSTGSPVKTEKE